MKRRLFCFFVAFTIFLGWGTFFQEVEAKGFSLSELSVFGIPGLKVHRIGPVACDGIISDHEYDGGVVYRDENGLFLFMNGKFFDGKLGSSSAFQENYVSLADDEIFCALRLRLDRSMLGEILKDGKPCYRVSFSLGLTPGDHPAHRGSLLTNTYYFSTSDQSCIGFCGERKARSVTEESVASKPLSTYVPSYRENGCVVKDGTKWTADHYCKNAAFSLVENGSVATVTVEVRIPLEDALLSVHPSQREEVHQAIVSNVGTLCGGLATSVDLNAYSSLVTGLPTDCTAVFSSEGITLREWIKQNCETPASGLFIPEVIPIPLYWCGDIPKIPETKVADGENILPDHDDSPAGTGTSAVPPESTTSKTAEGFSDDFVSDPSGKPVENDESIFASLPDAADLLPEDTEIVFDSKSITSDSSKKDHSLASSILATVTGAFLFASVMVLCMYFRDSAKKEETREHSKRKKKKNTNKGKNDP